MPSVSSPLLRDWDFLVERVVPPLVEVARADGRPSAWSVGGVADAVAVAAAYEHASPANGRSLRAFSSDAPGELSRITFSRSDLRGIPTGARSEAFERQDARWVPGPQISEQVLLSPPDGPVDLVTMRTADPDGEATTVAVSRLREGGHLFVVEPADLARSRCLRAVGGSRRLFRKGAPRPGPARRRAAPADPGGSVDTLAAHQAQCDLVATHARLARSLARRFFRHGEVADDLEQVALLALVRAARRFDPSRDTTFATYATASILGEIKRHFRDKTWMMRVPRTIQERYLEVKEAREALTQEFAASPTILQVSERLGVTEESVLEAMEAGENYWPTSLDAGVFEGEPGREVPVVDSGFEASLERQQVMSLLPRLAPREQLILKRLFFDGWTQRQVADETGVSQMQVSRLLARSLDRLRSGVGS
jgi:RNA polymerase sigma-B factor